MRLVLEREDTDGNFQVVTSALEGRALMRVDRSDGHGTQGVLPRHSEQQRLQVLRRTSLSRESSSATT